MEKKSRTLLGTVLAGALILAPIYLAILLLVKAVHSMVGLIQPIALLMPHGLIPEKLLALIVLVVLCLVVGYLARTPTGRRVRYRLEDRLFSRLPGYDMLRGLTRRLAGNSEEDSWQPALIQTDEGMTPGFIIERIDEHTTTVFLPSIPTPFAGSVFIMDNHRIHPVDMPFPKAMKVISRWGQGAADMYRALPADKHLPPGY